MLINILCVIFAGWRFYKWLYTEPSIARNMFMFIWGFLISWGLLKIGLELVK